MPIKRADIVVLLTFDEIERGIGCIAGALSDPTHSARQIAHEKETDKWQVKLASDTSNRKPLGGLGKDRVENDGAPLRKNSPGSFGQDLIND